MYRYYAEAAANDVAPPTEKKLHGVDAADIHSTISRLYKISIGTEEGR
jgi:hypothetical protein